MPERHHPERRAVAHPPRPSTYDVQRPWHPYLPSRTGDLRVSAIIRDGGGDLFRADDAIVEGGWVHAVGGWDDGGYEAISIPLDYVEAISWTA